MKIVINIMLNVGDNCDLCIEEIKDIMLRQINHGLSHHMHDHIHSIEVLSD
jgi:hypothetical protein